MGALDQIARSFGVDWPHLLSQMISFAIVCALLYRFAYAPVLKTLHARQQQIAQGLANAAAIAAERRQIDAERQDVLAAAQAEAARVIGDARHAARQITDREVLRARALGEQMVGRARDAAEQERRRMLADVRRNAAHLVVETTAAVAGKVLTDADQRRLAAEAARYLA